VGCFRDAGDRALPKIAVQDSGSLTIQQCIGWCKRAGYNYAGLQVGSWCFCGEFYDRFGTASNCDYRCTGNWDQLCGGAWANSVYSVADYDQK